MNDPQNGWSVYQNLVLSEIADLKKEMAEAHEEIILLRIDLATQKVKAGMWGAAMGMIPATAAALAAALGVFS